MNSKNVRVLPHGDKWAVQRDGMRASALYDMQSEAIDTARDQARRIHGELQIHGQNGQIRARDSYGNDPRASKG